MYKDTLAHSLPQTQVSLGRNSSHLPIKTNIMLLESFQSGRHGNTFRLTQSTWQAEEKGRKQHFHRLHLGIRIFINYPTHIIITNVAITIAT